LNIGVVNFQAYSVTVVKEKNNNNKKKLFKKYQIYHPTFQNSEKDKKNHNYQTT
jgi:hypothetical protein